LLIVIVVVIIVVSNIRIAPVKCSTTSSIFRQDYIIINVWRLIENISKKLWRFKELFAIWLIRKDVLEEPIYMTSANSNKINVYGIAYKF
jgi:hypothetical protein